jgi:hypothetical protein
MDATTLVMPGAQSLVTAVLTDTWNQARAALANRWARRHPAADGRAHADPEPAAIEQAARELDVARQQSLDLAGSGSDADREARMRLFWAGYLAGQLAARPELATALADLPALFGAGKPASQTTNVHNSFSGKSTGTVVQAGDIQGGINIHGR